MTVDELDKRLDAKNIEDGRSMRANLLDHANDALGMYKTPRAEGDVQALYLKALAACSKNNVTAIDLEGIYRNVIAFMHNSLLPAQPPPVVRIDVPGIIVPVHVAYKSTQDAGICN